MDVEAVGEPALVSTIRRVDAASDWCRFVAGPPTTDGWSALADLVGDGFDAWFDTCRDGAAAGRADVAASYLASWAAAAVLLGPTMALLLDRRCWSVDVGSLAVHRHDDGWIDGVAVEAEGCHVVAGDPAAEQRGVTVFPDVDALRAQLAAEAAVILDPLFARLRSRAPFGIAGMWGVTADTVVGDAVWSARQAGTDPDAAAAEAQAVVDHLARRATRLRVRPRLVDVPWSGGVAALPRRGTCCLWFKTVPDHDPDPCGEGYCSSCPRRDPDDQVARWGRWLDAGAGAGA